MRCQSILLGLHEFVSQSDNVHIAFDLVRIKIILRANSSKALHHTRRVDVAEVECCHCTGFIASDAFDAIVLQIERAVLVLRRVAKGR